MAKKKAEPGLAPVQLHVGDVPLLVREAFENVVRQMFGDNVPAMSIIDFDGGSASAAEVLDEVRTASFLAPRKLVRVRDADALLKSKGDDSSRSKSRSPRELFEALCESPSDVGVLLLQAKSEARTTRLFKAVDKLGGVVACSVDKRFDAVAWVCGRAEALLGKRIAIDAAELLAEAIGADLTLLANELEKLALFVGDEPAITAEHVAALVGHSRVDTVFAISDDLVDGRVPQALAQWRRLVETDRDTPFKAVGGFAFSVRQMLAVRRRLDAGANVMQAIQETGAWRLKSSADDPKRLDRRLGAFTTPRLEQALADLLHVDYASKSGLADVEPGVERFLVKTAAAINKLPASKNAR